MKAHHHYDFAVIGAGILGLATAYHLAKAGHKVAVFERGVKATGASIRKFGMVWPIGQPPGEMREIALRSRTIWMEALAASGLWHKTCGSLHLAYAEDELDVLEEFVKLSPSHGYECEILGAQGVAQKSPVVKQQGLRGALWSPSELCVFPRQVVWEFPQFLESLGVHFHYGCAITRIEVGRIFGAGQEYGADQVIVCSGDDFETLYPEYFNACGLTRSKLQMMRARPLSDSFRIETHLCAGLTLGHYANFRICERLEPLLTRFHRDYPEHVAWGIHLLVSQHENGWLTIGDSHEYGLGVTPFLQERIDQLILAYFDTFLPVDELEVVERWHGVYAKHPTKNYVIEKLDSNVLLITGVGGAGMTLSFGITEKALLEAGLIACK